MATLGFRCAQTKQRYMRRALSAMAIPMIKCSTTLLAIQLTTTGGFGTADKGTTIRFITIKSVAP
jgi:hypothetical protein